MKKVPNDYTEEENEEMNDAVREEKILPFDLAMQIFPLLEDYFLAHLQRTQKAY